MSERISDTNNGTANSEARTPRFNRSKTVQVIISILVALALWVYVDVEKAPERTKTIRDVPVEFSGENTTLADKNLMLLSGYDTTIDLTIRGPGEDEPGQCAGHCQYIQHRFRGRTPVGLDRQLP